MLVKSNSLKSKYPMSYDVRMLFFYIYEFELNHMLKIKKKSLDI